MGSITQTIASILGDSQVRSWEALPASCQHSIQGAIAAAPLPDCVAYPTSTAQLSELVSCAHQNRWRLLICGQGSKLSWGNWVQGAHLVVSTQYLNQLVDHAVGDLTITAAAGMPFSQLQETLLGTRQFLPIDPAYPRQATLGGIIATQNTGALRQRYGGLRDLSIGLSFVRYDGQLAKAGGRVVKNVAGYDLMKLMTGAFGTLGILAELTFRTYPLQEASQTLVMGGSFEAIQSVLSDVRQSSLTPVALDVLSANLIGTHFEAAAFPCGLAVQFQSIEAGVKEQVSRLEAIAAAYPVDMQVLSEHADSQLWSALTERLFPTADRPPAAIAKIGILPTQAVPLLATLQDSLAPNSWQARIHAGSGIGTLRLAPEENTTESLGQIRSHCQAWGGYLCLLEAPAPWKTALDAWALTESTQKLMKRLQDQFDPYRSFNPGRFRTS